MDQNGKQREWEATSLIPFLDEETLHASAASIGDEQLSPIEAKRNRHGESVRFVPTGKPPPGMEDSAQANPPRARKPSAPPASKQRVVKGHQAG